MARTPDESALPGWIPRLARRRRTQVLVVGGGHAGIAAAVAAGRLGAQVLVVERYGCLGGTGTVALLSNFGPLTDRAGTVQVIRGLAQEIEERLYARGAIDGVARGYHTYHVEEWKRLADELVAEAGAGVLFHTWCVDAVMGPAGRVRGVVVATKAGLELIEADVVVDATGDGDVAVRAGAPWEQGRPGDGKTQPMTLIVRLGGVDLERYARWRRHEYPQLGLQGSVLVERAIAAGDLTFAQGMIHGAAPVPGAPGVCVINFSRVFADGTDPDDLSRAEVEGRRQVPDVLRFFRKYVPGFEQAWVVDTGTQIGVRETRRVVGDYQLTADDIVAGRRFDDQIACNAYHLDLHNPTDGGHTHVFLEPGVYYGIPYRCLLPRGREGLLVAGRCISATFEAHASVRISPCCLAVGQAAGVAAALAAARGVAPREVDVLTIQDRLREQGAFLGARVEGRAATGATYGTHHQ